MPNERKLCWGGCGRFLVFRLITAAGRRRVMAFDAVNGDPHNCPRPASAPRVFVEAMQDYSKPVKCDGCGNMVYEVPTCGGVEQFDTVDGKWHECLRPHGVLKGIWNLPIINLAAGCSRFSLPKPHRLTVIVCVKRIVGDDPLYLVALKDVSGQKVCAVFTGQGQLKIGELSALCGDGHQRTLLTNSNDVFYWDGQGQPGDLTLPHNWLETGN